MSKSTINRIIAVAVLIVISAAAMIIVKSRIVVTDPSSAVIDPSDTEYEPVITSEAPADTETDTEPVTDDTDEPPADEGYHCILKETSPASTDYFERLVFIGDRTIGDMSKFAITELPRQGEQIWSCSENMSIENAIVTENYLYPNWYEFVSFATAIKDYMPQYAILTFGSYTDNEDLAYTNDTFVQDYAELYIQLKACSPNTEIIIQSILPVANTCQYIAPEQIKERNEWLKGFCEQNAIYYLDTYSALADEDGYLKGEYSDPYGISGNIQGYTMNEAGYRELIEYVRTHAHPFYTPEA